VKLIHHPLSSSSRRASVTAAHLGIALEHRLIDLGKPEDRAAVAAINPNAKIPVLVDGDLVLWESHAIMTYLCGKTPGQTLYPTDLAERADVDRWLFWTASHLSPCVAPINFERMWKRFTAGGEPDASVIARYERFFHQFAAVLDKHLIGRTWIAGDRTSLADLSVGATLMYAQPTKLPIDAYQNVLALVARVHALPAWQATEASRVL
jgi:glutathione S-transferase